MSWKSLVSAVMLCGLVAVPAAADPSLSIDFVRNGMGNPVLDPATGGWQYLVTVTPDAAVLSTTSENGAATVASAAKDATNFPNDNPGNSPFAFSGNGVQVNANEVLANLGSDFFTSGTPQDAVTIVVGRVASNPANGGLTANVDVVGAYDTDAVGNGTPGSINTHYRLAQDGTNFQIPNSNQSASVAAGDTDLDGDVDLDDVFNLSPNFGQPGTFIFHDGDIDGDGDVDLDDVFELSPNFGQPGPPAPGSGSAVPEPTSVLLVLLGATLAAVARVRR